MAKLGGLVAVVPLLPLPLHLLLLLLAVGCTQAAPTPSAAPALSKLEDSARPVSVALSPSSGNLLQVQVAKQQQLLQQQQQQVQVQIQQRANNVEKLKRGLTNLMNTKHNQASYFVPALAPGSSVKSSLPMPGNLAGTSAAESAAIVNPDPLGGDVLIKGPRLSQTRPIGGPLRWGR